MEEMHYFEPAEIIQEDAVHASKRCEGRKFWDRHLPLTTVWTPLETILKKKLNKKYDPEAKPLSLLLYYERGSPSWELLEPLLMESKARVQATLEASVFDLVWLFDANDNNVLFSFSRSSGLIIR